MHTGLLTIAVELGNISSRFKNCLVPVFDGSDRTDWKPVVIKRKTALLEQQLRQWDDPGKASRGRIAGGDREFRDQRATVRDLAHFKIELIARVVRVPGPHGQVLVVKFHDMLSRMFRDTLSSSSTVGRTGKWETGSVFQGGSAAVFSSLCGGDRDPLLNDRRVLDRGFELPDQSVAVIDVEASPNSDCRALSIRH